MRLQECCLGVGLYPLFLYANFSGYTDFVIGIAALFRITLPENFNHPFAATNFIDFWNRWHITLSQWLKSYVYTPVLLAAMRRVRARAWRPWLGIAAYFCTFFLVGIWHGQSSEFLFFGVLQGAGVAINKLYQTLPLHRIPACRRVMRQAAYTAFCRGLTFTWFTFTLLWFWSSWAQLRAIGWPLILASMLILLPAATLALTAMYQTPWPHRALSRYARTARATALAVVILATNLVLSAPAPQIVYKAF
jgi:D-alanyl-lipoteichoic acid acyltransferase DltB (MBOAT superfamily)